MATSAPVTPTIGNFNSKDYDRFLECVHCGLCLPACPTYLETGREADSPRGRVYIMKNVADGRLGGDSKMVANHLDLCLGCMACETACPSGVHYGHLIEKARSVIEENYPRPMQDKFLRRMMSALLPYPSRLELALLPIRLLRALKLDALLESEFIRKLMPKKIRPMLSLVPELPPLGARNSLSEVIPAQGERKYRVAMLKGCVMSVMFSRQNEATARVLARNGCEVIVPSGQGCCGSLHMHMGYRQAGTDLVKNNLDVFEPDEFDAIISNAAGCGAMMKEYGEVFADDPAYAKRAHAFAAKTQDLSEFLASIELNTEFGEVRAKATYHDACHLVHAQKVSAQPRALLEKIPGLELVPLTESELCCGSAGPYNLVEPEMADRLQARKVNHIIETGADMVVMGNPGCMIQIDNGLKKQGVDMEVLHTVEVLDRAYQ